MSIGAYCHRCQSAFCNHCLQINEHNSRMEYDRLRAGMPINFQSEMVMRIEDAIVTVATTGNNKNKMLLLLRKVK